MAGGALLRAPATCLPTPPNPRPPTHPPPGKGYVDVSTVDAPTSRAVAAAVAPTGAAFLEAPVSGSKGPAEAGQLIFLTAGDRGLYDAATPLLEAMGKASFYLGERKWGSWGRGWRAGLRGGGAAGLRARQSQLIAPRRAPPVARAGDVGAGAHMKLVVNVSAAAVCAAALPRAHP